MDRKKCLIKRWLKTYPSGRKIPIEGGKRLTIKRMSN
jgi:hypothetical protein